MNLESDKRLNIQLRLDFSSAPTGEARQALREDIESLPVVHEPERPANTSMSQRRLRAILAAEAYARRPAMIASILFIIAAAFWISAAARARVRCSRARSGRFLILYSCPRSIWILARMVPRSLNCS